MFTRLLVAAVLAAGLLAVPGGVPAQEKAKAPARPEAKPRTGQTEAILSALRESITFEGDLTQTPLTELLANLARKYELNIVVRSDLFKAEGEPAVGDRRLDVTVMRLDGVSLRRFLDLTLGGMNATYLVRKGVVEIVPVRYAAKETDGRVEAGEGGERVRLAEPLVSAIYKEKPLNEALADLAEEYDLTVVVGPQAGDNRMAFVSARLLNVPADKALELIAVQADLRVVPKGASFLITSRDHANELFGEKLEKEKQKLEVEKLRKEAANPPPPPPLHLIPLKPAGPPPTPDK
jgi:hypothetical protein